MKLDKTFRLKNGAIILGKKIYRHADEHIRSIIAYFEAANEPYVSWAYNLQDKGCFWRNYYNHLHNAFNTFFKRGDAIDMNKYQSVELHATRNGEVCSLKDEFNSFTFFGKVPITEQLEYLAEIYSLETAIEFGHWLINEYNIKIENKILINN